MVFFPWPQTTHDGPHHQKFRDEINKSKILWQERDTKFTINLSNRSSPAANWIGHKGHEEPRGAQSLFYRRNWFFYSLHLFVLEIKGHKDWMPVEDRHAVGGLFWTSTFLNQRKVKVFENQEVSSFIKKCSSSLEKPNSLCWKIDVKHEYVCSLWPVLSRRGVDLSYH